MVQDGHVALKSILYGKFDSGRSCLWYKWTLCFEKWISVENLVEVTCGRKIDMIYHVINRCIITLESAVKAKLMGY